MCEIVSFEIAKKLKEKGFDYPCIYAYCEKGGWNMYTQKHEPITYQLRTDGNPFGSFYIGKNWNIKYERNKNKIKCSAPTISQVLKWLREEKKMFVQISLFQYCYDYCILDTTMVYYDNEHKVLHQWPTGYSYNEAALAGIEYILDNNLI